MSRFRILRLRCCPIGPVGQAIKQSRSRQTRDCAAQESPADRVRGPGLSTATFVSIAAIVGAAVIVLTAVVGFGCYRFLRDLFGKPPRQLDA